jgi:pyruvate/2-oxoglutarate dehydrogenase complex dihydrolipoamide dehydrogenase (E3) component
LVAAKDREIARLEGVSAGGTCVICGCVPKKLFVYASRFSDTFDEAAEFGWRLSVPYFDWPAPVKKVRASRS